MTATVDLLSSLNAAQREAVTHEGGPLVVLAGPGTGKTRVIVHRVAHLIAERGVDPERVLVSTFTVKAAGQLRERLAGLIGPAKAERVGAHTLHGLGLRLLRRFGDTLGLGRAMTRGPDIIDSAQSRRLLRELILEHDLFGAERAAGVDALCDLAAKHFEHFENHGLCPAGAAGVSERWRAACAAGTGPGGEALDEDGSAAMRARQARFDAVCRLYRLYTAARRERGLITYGDLLLLPVEMFRKRPDVAAICRDELRHVIVDEFQDVNRAMIGLLRALAPPEGVRGGDKGKPSGGQELVVVGDDDQSIYGFRGADDRAFWRFESVWPGGRRIALTENYRSCPRIIAVGNAIIGRAAERFEPAKRIEFPAGKEAGGGGAGEVECVTLSEDKSDGGVIAAMLRADRARRGGGDDEQKPWRRYAVVTRSNSDLERVREALWLEGIPTAQAGAGTAADDEGVRSVLAWAGLLVRPREAWNAYRLLARPPFGVAVATITAWDRLYRSALSRWRHGDSGGLEGSEDDPGPFALWLGRRAGGDPAVARFAGLYERFAAVAAEESAASMLHRIVRDTGVIHADLPGPRDRAARAGHVVSLLSFAQERQRRLTPPGGLREFLEYYDDLSEGDRGFGAGGGEESIDGGAADASGGEEEPDAVRLTTAHKAKGLEFDTVFVPRVHPQWGYGQARADDGPDVPEELIGEGGESLGAAKLAGKERSRAEERRLFYVACTRAEGRLVVLARRNKGPSKTTNFFEELLGDDSLKGGRRERTEEEVLNDPALLDVPGARPLTGGEGRRELIERARREVRLAAAAALSRCDCPGCTSEECAAALTELRLAAGRLASIAALEAGAAAPAWAGDDDTVIARLREACADDGGGCWPDEPVLTPPKGPLKLSFTLIRDYQACPRCWYVKHVLGFAGPEGARQVLGIALHRAFERFYRAQRAGDECGEAAGAPPTLAMLERYAREEFFAQVGQTGMVKAPELDQLIHQIRLGFERLHDPEAQVLEIEKSIRFKYVCEGASVEHDFEVKLDRLDQVTMPDGSAGFRIVDYKTGAPTKTVTEPGAADLQLGVYAMALRRHFDADVDGYAEYWVCATGGRGSVPISKIAFDKVRRVIDGAVEGILAGRFGRGKDCHGTCEILGP